MRRMFRRTVRRTSRRASRHLRRKVVVGGFVLLAAGGAAAAYKLTHKDVERIEAHSGVKVEEIPEDKLIASMKELGIKSIELDADDRATIAKS